MKSDAARCVSAGAAAWSGEETTLRIAAALLLTLLLGLTGCAGMSRRSNDARAAANGANPGTPPPRFPTADNPNPGPGPGSVPGDPLLGSAINVPVPPASAGVPQGSAILAGRVIDGSNRPPSNTAIQCINLTDNKATPLDVSVNKDGYFTIQGLKQGAKYKLVARGKQGDRMVAQTAYFTAPNVRVLIQVREDFASAGTPNPPGPPAVDKKGDIPPPKEPTTDVPAEEKKSEEKKDEKSFEGTSAITKPRNDGGAWSPGLPSNANLAPLGQSAGGNDAELPIKITVPAHNNNGPPPTFIPGVTLDGRSGGLPVLEIPNPKGPPPPSPSIPDGAVKPAVPGNISTGPTRVPSIVLVGNKLVNFALNDINGEAWEFKTSKRGRLMLIDFWSTNCIPCRQSMPVLRSLQNQYGPRGLEVVGVACESGDSTQEMAYRVNSLSQRMQLNYRQLLSTGPQCVVRQQFGIRAVPTMVVVDDQGWILWRHEGAPDRATAEELERLIQRRLSAPNSAY
jgi:thiol-disulfide isomerase/thioredoxin